MSEDDTINITFPDVTVQMTGEDGNAFMIIGRVDAALRRAGATKDEIKAFTDEAFSAPGYDALLQLVMRTVNVN